MKAALLTTFACMTASLVMASPLVDKYPAEGLAKRQETNVTAPSDITYLGNVGATLSGGTKFGDLVFVSGQVPFANGTLVEGGVRNETAQCLANIGAILEEAGTSWERVLKVSVLLQNISDLAAVNEVYSELVPNPKPARAAYQVGYLPVEGISIEIEAIAAMPPA